MLTNPDKLINLQELAYFEEKLASKYATQTAMAQAVADVTPDYIDIEDLEVGMTFPKNALLAINGISFQALRNTTDFPVTVLVESGHVVYDEDENGNKALVVSDWAKSNDWKVWGDAGIPRTLDNMTAQQESFMTNEQADMESFKAEIRGIAGTSIKSGTMITSSSGTKYSVQTLLVALADLMDKTIVVQPSA